MLRHHRSLTRALLLTLAFGCGTGGDDGTSSETSGTTGPGTTGPGTTNIPTSDTTDPSTTNIATDTSTGPGTTLDTTTSPATSTGPDSTGPDSTDTGDESTGPAIVFERFKMSSAAGPCPPDSDCDGFVELLGTMLLRVETFGDVSNTVTEVEISADDFSAAVPVFTDPALIALLDGADPLCDPPTDIFESMEVEIDGMLHDATTTTCDQAAIAAARDMAIALRDEYVP